MYAHKLPSEEEFFILLLETYAESKGIRAAEALELWENAGILQYVKDSYFIYHIERLENAFADIDAMLKTNRQ